MSPDHAFEDVDVVLDTNTGREMDVVEASESMVAFQDGIVRSEMNRQKAERRLENGDIRKVD